MHMAESMPPVTKVSPYRLIRLENLLDQHAMDFLTGFTSHKIYFPAHRMGEGGGRPDEVNRELCRMRELISSSSEQKNPGQSLGPDFIFDEL